MLTLSLPNSMCQIKKLKNNSNLSNLKNKLGVVVTKITATKGTTTTILLVMVMVVVVIKEINTAEITVRILQLIRMNVGVKTGTSSSVKMIPSVSGTMCVMNEANLVTMLGTAHTIIVIISCDHSL